MKILQVHNYYKYSGGEDIVVENEKRLLESNGHEVRQFIKDNKTITLNNLFETIHLLFQTIYNVKILNELNDFILNYKPDIVHIHNTFPLISPSIFYYLKKNKIPTVVSLHNPRLMCPAATFQRNNKSCTICKRKYLQWPAVFYKCYRNSYIESTVIVMYNFIHKALKTWQEKVDVFIVFTDLYKNQFIEYGLPQSKIVIKQHFIHEDKASKNSTVDSKKYAVFIGRLMAEKGILLLLNSWDKNFPVILKIRGEGPLKDAITKIIQTKELNNIELVARLSENELHDLISGAEFLIWPSLGLYETFGLVAVEAYLHSISVIASNDGVMKNIVNDLGTGILFNSGDEKDLRVKLKWAIDHPEEMKRMGKNARKEYDEKYTAEKNYGILMGIYKKVIENNKSF